MVTTDNSSLLAKILLIKILLLLINVAKITVIAIVMGMPIQFLMLKTKSAKSI